MKKLRHLVEFLLVWPLLLLMFILPFRALGVLMAGVARLWLALDRRRAEICMHNIMRAGVARDTTHAAAIARASIAHFGLVLSEMVKARKILGPDFENARITCEIAPAAQALLDDPESGLVIAGGHFGNWEICGQHLSRIKPITAIARQMNNPYIDALLQKYKPRGGMAETPKRSKDPNRLLRILRDGGGLAILTDQHAREKGVMVPFFGHPASTHKVVALLHLGMRAPLVYTSCRRVGPGRFHLRMTAPLQIPRSGDRRKDVETVLLTLNRELENDIRRWPGQYNWAHRRWRDTPLTSASKAASD